MSYRQVLLVLPFLILSNHFTFLMSLSPSSVTSRNFDLVIYGATVFTGQLAVEYVHTHYPGLKFALAGRNLAKLESVRARVCGAESKIPLIVADAVEDPQALQNLAASTKVIANYAGTPFFDKALPVVEACVKQGTCYSDITGEVPFQRVSYDR